MKTLEQLVDVTDPGWPIVQDWLAKATNSFEIFPVDEGRAREVLLALQVTTRSPMGAIAYATGGLSFDHGWLRFLGSGSDQLPRDIAAWNRSQMPVDQQRLPGALLVADDAVGGFFALNGGAFNVPPGHIQYFAPNALEWEATQFTYSQFLMWACTGDLQKFYEGCRWASWEQEVEKLGGDRGISIYPFLWAQGPPTAERSRRDLPIEEVWESQMYMHSQMNG